MGIYAYIRKDGEPIDGRETRQFLGEIGSVSHRGQSWVIWQGDSALLACLSAPRQQSHYLTVSDHLAVVGMVRLHNRGEIRKRLGVARQTTDLELILNGFREWGRGLAERLEGDFSFFVWDKLRKSAYAARGAGIGCGMYWRSTPRELEVSSAIRPLRRRTSGVSRINEARLAQLLVGWEGDGTQTIYDGIKRFPGAHFLVSEGGSEDLRCYWDFDGLQECRFANDSDYVDAFEDIYTQAIGSRLERTKQVALALSGGLDSASCAAVLSEAVGKNSFRAFCWSPQHSVDLAGIRNWRADDSPLARSVCQELPNADLEVFHARNRSPLRGIDWGHQTFSQPEYGSGSFFWIAGLYDAVQLAGIESLFFVQFGNLTISWSPRPDEYARRMLRRFRLGEALSALQFIAREKGLHTWRSRIGLCKRQMVKAVSEVGSWQRRELSRSEFRAWLDSESTYVCPQFANRIHLYDLFERSDYDPLFRRPPSRKRRWNLMQGMMTVCSSQFQELALDTGVQVLDPSSDRRVQEFCFSIPESQYLGLTDRWLVRRFLSRKYSASIALERRRGIQGVDLGVRLKQELGRLKTIVEALDSSALVREHIQVENLWKIIGDVEIGKQAHQNYLSLMRVVGIGLFLLRTEGSASDFEELKEGVRT